MFTTLLRSVLYKDASCGDVLQLCDQSKVIRAV